MSRVENLRCVHPDWPVSRKVNVLTTTRLGGVSTAPFDALNLGLHVGDNLQAVLENRRRLQQQCALPSQPVWLNQTHSTSILDVVEKDAVEKDVIATKACDTTNADGSFTRLPDTVLAVLTADCLPVVISDKQGSQLAVVHAGWRGLAGGILTQAISRFDKGSALFAWLGPAIGPTRFEVGKDVYDVFTQRNPANTNHFKEAQLDGKYWADLYALARTELVHASCAVFGGDYCTYSQDDLFHSHRRDGSASGRIATVAWISAD